MRTATCWWPAPSVLPHQSIGTQLLGVRRPWRSISLADEQVAQLIDKAWHTKPADGATHSSTRALAGQQARARAPLHAISKPSRSTHAADGTGRCRRPHPRPRGRREGLSGQSCASERGQSLAYRNQGLTGTADSTAKPARSIARLQDAVAKDAPLRHQNQGICASL